MGRDCAFATNRRAARKVPVESGPSPANTAFRYSTAYSWSPNLSSKPYTLNDRSESRWVPKLGKNSRPRGHTERDAAANRLVPGPALPNLFKLTRVT